MAVPADLAELLESGAHFGHQVRRWNPKMAPYIYTQRDGVHIFDLTITAKKLDEACAFLKEQAKLDKKIIFVGTKRQAKAIVREEAISVEAMYVAERWMGGTVTNWEEIGRRVKKMRDMKLKRESGDYDKYTKKEVVLIDREIARLERFFGGIEKLNSRPDVLVVVDPSKEKVCIKEAVNRGIKVIAITDSNCDPDMVDFVIPANDDAVRSIKYILNRLATAYGEGKGIKKAKIKSNETEPTPKAEKADNKKKDVAKTKAKSKSKVKA